MGKGKRFQNQKKKMKKICSCCGSPKIIKPFEYYLNIDFNEPTKTISYEATPYKKGLTKLIDKNDINQCIFDLINNGKKYAKKAIETDDENHGYMRNFCFDTSQEIINRFYLLIDYELIKELKSFKSHH